jgi:hypothetical protein
MDESPIATLGVEGPIGGVGVSVIEWVIAATDALRSGQVALTVHFGAGDYSGIICLQEGVGFDAG